MFSKDVRKGFVDFFKSKGHSFVPSSSLVLGDDPTLLFVNAGMNQFKQIFLGNETPKYKRVANYQKCLRVSGKHNDLEDVGYDTYHHTFFEMLGNWSFGDYYKEEAILWAWELFTKLFKLPKERLYATVYNTDDEAYNIWEKMDIDKSHILRFSDKENFWEMGNTGPCGPCSEIHIDLGYCPEKSRKHECGVNKCGRFVELWNLVFIQYNREEDGSLTPLKDKHVDTGAGLERLTAVLQNKTSNYDTDLFMPIINHIEDRIDKRYQENEVAMRVIADHIRALTFSISDGVTPSNEGRGYVIRRILRRAYRYGHKLGFREPFLYEIVDVVKDIMGNAYSIDNIDTVKKIIKIEEEKFASTLEKGLYIFEEIASKSKNVFPGDKAFVLYDTYGFPIDLTNILCKEKGLKLDEDGFNRCMNEQKERGRSSSSFEYKDKSIDFIEVKKGDVNFVGYDTLSTETSLIKYARLEGDRIALVISPTPFYAESGGQVGDKGIIKGDRTFIEVYDVKKIGSDYVHFGIAKSFDPNDNIVAEVDFIKRKSTERNHTATHLLHKALRLVLGDHVRQSGSLVDENRLRFDFSHFAKMTDQEIKKVEDIVNEAIFKAMSVETGIYNIDEARSMGAIALFGEKYGERVRVVKAGDFSIEFCGGTHVKNTSEIGVFKIVSESSVASGIRRIEAVTSMNCYKILSDSYNILTNILSYLNVDKEKALEKIESIIKENKKTKKSSVVNKDVKETFSKGNISVYIESFSVESPKDLLAINDIIKSKKNNYISILFGNGDKTYYLCSVSGIDLSVRDIADFINKKYNGRGGGKDIIQGVISGGVDINDVIDFIKTKI